MCVDRHAGWGLVRRNAAFRSLWTARVVSFLGDSLGLVALIILVADEVGSGVAVGLLLLAGDFTPSLVSPLIGALADRLPPRRTMIACELGQAVAVGTIAAADVSLPVVLALIAAQSLLAATFQATSRSSVADLVADEDLETANAFLGFGTYGLEAAGPLLAAALLPFLSPRAVLAVDAATFLVAPVLLAGLPALAGHGDASERGGIVREARAGLGHLWRHRLLRGVTLAFVAVVAFNAVDDVALVFLGSESLGTSDAGVGLLYAGSGVGMLAGFALLARRSRVSDPLRWTLAGFAVVSAGNLLTGASPVLAAALAMQLVRGVGLSLIDVGSSTLVQRTVPRELRGRVFANLYGAVGFAAGCSYAIGGPLVDLLSPRTALVLAGAGGLAATACAALYLAPRGPLGSSPFRGRRPARR